MPIFADSGSKGPHAVTQCGVCLRQVALTPLERHEEFTLYECGSCRGQFWHPMKNPGAEWYEKEAEGLKIYERKKR